MRAGPEGLFCEVKELLGPRRSPVCPPGRSNTALCSLFSNYFIDNISVPRQQLEMVRVANVAEIDIDEPDINCSLSGLKKWQKEETLKIIRSLATKSCKQDPISTWMLKSCIGELLPVITGIVNISLSTGNFPSQLKSALVTPLLKKAYTGPGITQELSPCF